uniref:Uncharacterized protein n=1 Tax=Oryza glumipatula TaxID=40148 RepID=A0A0E0AHC1_9ORYZ
MQTERDSIGLNANVSGTSCQAYGGNLLGTMLHDVVTEGTYLCKSSPQLSAERQTSIDLGAILHKLGSRCAYGDIGLLVWEYFLPCDGLATGTHVRFPTST